MVYYQEKMVDRDALCPKNVMSSNFSLFPNEHFWGLIFPLFQISGLWTNFGPISVNLIFYAPNVTNFSFGG